MQVVMHLTLLVTLTLHYILQLLLFEFSSTAHFVDFQIEQLVWGFGLALDDLELLAVIGDLCNGIVHFARKLFDSASQAVTDCFLASLLSLLPLGCCNLRMSLRTGLTCSSSIWMVLLRLLVVLVKVFERLLLLRSCLKWIGALKILCLVHHF